MTINLEKELIKANKKIIVPSELLLVNEYEKSTEILEDDALERVGVLNSIKQGAAIKNKIDKLKAETLKFDQERVFHISQIEEICGKYLLRFLPSVRYKGSVDKDLAFKINNFEAAYNVKCKCEPIPERHFADWSIYIHPVTGLPTVRTKEKIQNTYIMAPKESFNLQARPKDPLFFYQINSEYYYLIHKWGNDLSVARRIKGFLSSEKNCFMLICMVQALFLLSSLSLPGWMGWVFSIINGVCLTHTIFIHFKRQPGERLSIYKNRWQSQYID